MGATADAVLAAVSRVLAPREITLDSSGGNWALAVTTTAARIEIPERMRGRYVSVRAETASCWIQYGDSAVDVDRTEQNTVTSEAVTESDTVGYLVPSGQQDSWIVPDGATHMAVEGDATGTLYVRISSEGVAK